MASLKSVTLIDIQKDYQKLAPEYDHRWQKFLALSQSNVLQNWPQNLPENARILDLGCGTGSMLAQIHDQYPDYRLTGVDCSNDMLKIARENVPNANFIEADIENIDLPHKGFDVVLSLNILHHLNDQKSHLETLKKLAKPDGDIFLCDFITDGFWMKLADFSWQRSQQSYHKSFSYKEMEELLKDAKLEILQQEILKPDWFWRLQSYKLRNA